MGKMNKTTTIYDFPNENFRKKFYSKEEALKHIEGKLPSNGKNWFLRKTVTIIEEETIESERKVIENKDIIKRIIDTFIDKANVNNVRFGSSDTPYKVTDPKYSRLTYGQAHVYYMAEKLGYPWEKLDDIYANKDGIMNHRWDEEHHGYDTFEDREFYTNWLAPFFIIKEVFPEYNIDEKDITIRNYNYGRLERSEPEKPGSRKYIHYDDPTTLAGKYPKMMEYYIKNWHSNMSIFNTIYVQMKEAEALEEYKKRIKEYPIDKVVVEYNYGDYRPCHNYKISFPSEFDPRGEKYWNTMNIFARIPGIMFRNDDIYITNDNYIGRHVNHHGANRVDENEELYKYCIKNLK